MDEEERIARLAVAQLLSLLLCSGWRVQDKAERLLSHPWAALALYTTETLTLGDMVLELGRRYFGELGDALGDCE